MRILLIIVLLIILGVGGCVYWVVSSVDGLGEFAADHVRDEIVPKLTQAEMEKPLLDAHRRALIEAANILAVEVEKFSLVGDATSSDPQAALKSAARMELVAGYSKMLADNTVTPKEYMPLISYFRERDGGDTPERKAFVAFYKLEQPTE